MKDSIENYFNAEKSESALFVLTGSIAIVSAIYWLLKTKQPFYNGLAFAFIAIALVQLTVGLSVYFRSDKDIARVENIVQVEKSKITTEEIPRMKTVMKNFKIYRWVEIACILIGVFLFLYTPPVGIWKGLGLGLFTQAGLMLLFDYFAESRGKTYLEYLYTTL